MPAPNFSTEAIKYMGSKQKILPYIWNTISDLNVKSVLDGFAGSTRVSQFFKNNGISVLSNDLNIWSKVFGECYLLNNKPISFFEPLILELNSKKPTHGWFSEYYGGLDNNGSSVQEDGRKRIWQIHNTMKLDAIRETIDHWDREGRISAIDKSVLLTSLILALDKVDSSLGHQVSYLNKWSARSFNPLTLKVPSFVLNNTQNKVTNLDIFDILKNSSNYDLAYFDPPYGSANDIMPSSRVRYGQYYHLWKTVILNDKPSLKGKASKRADADAARTFSVFEDYQKNDKGVFNAQVAIEKLITATHSKYILLSYSTTSRVPIPGILDFLEKSNYEFSIQYIDYSKNIMAGLQSSQEWANLANKENKEILLLIKK